MHLKSLVLCLLVGASLQPANAQHNNGMPESRYLGTVRFGVLNGGIILGKALLKGFPDSLNFIFDTGCGGVSLDSATAEHYHLVPETNTNYIRGIAGKCHQKLLQGMTLSGAGIKLDSVTMQVS